MATLIKADGTEKTVMPPGGKKSFEFHGEGQLYELVGTDTIQLITLASGQIMAMDEDGKFKEPQEINKKATLLLSRAGGIPGDYIVGTVVIGTEKEMGY